MRQLIIVRKDLNMSVGKTAVQCCHASQAWLMDKIKSCLQIQQSEEYERLPSHQLNRKSGHLECMTYKRNDLCEWSAQAFANKEPCFWIKSESKDISNKEIKIELVSENDVVYHYITGFALDRKCVNNWIYDIQIKTICGAKNKTQLLKAVTMAQELGLEENKDFFLIYDRCLTELTPEEQDEDGGKTLTCIGFRPLDDEVVHKISKKYQLL